MTVTPAILRAFADLAPAGQRASLDVTAGGQPLAWLGLRTMLTTLRAEPADSEARVAPPPGPQPPTRVPATRATDRLAATDALHKHERLLREGWVYLVGTAVIDGDRRRICHPLLSRPVVLAPAIRSFALVAVGDLEISPLVLDPQTAAQLEAGAEFGGGALEAAHSPLPEVLPRLARLIDWIHRVGKAAGLPVDEVVDWTRAPERWRDADRVVAVVGAGLHLSRDVGRPGLGDVLRSWAEVPGIDDTAFGRLYADRDEPAGGDGGVRASASEPAGGDGGVVRSPLPLSPAQREVLCRVRAAPLVAVSGAPGNGKSHVVAATAIDAVARGHSVLIATPSRYAADVIGELLYRQPGPEPVLFGSSATRRDIAADLADGAGAFARAAAEAARVAAAEAECRVSAVEEPIRRLLATETAAEELPSWEPLLPELARTAPGVFAPGADLDRIGALLVAAERDGDGWISALRRRLATARLRGAAGAPVAPSLVRRALSAAHSRRAAAELASIGGTRIGALWDELFAADAAAAEALGRHVQALARRARVADRGRTAAVTGLAMALRSGRASRREQLRRLDAAALTNALPLWVGALTDIDDLLPEQPGLFDLVILDEASQIDQLRAAPALLRARRAAVVGDPRQLRHVSFIADADQRRALRDVGPPALTARLDVRRMSVFDAAAAVSPVSFLDEHHRSVPHLIAFSDRRFYGGRLRIRTRHPATESVDAIHVVHVRGGTVVEGVNAAEVAAVGEELERLAERSATSIGVISPFRAQADALEAMLLERFDVAAIERLGLRVGTVHAFQGAERDIIVLSLGLTVADADQRRRFVEDPHLCNVMVTRARRRMVVVTSLEDAGDGIVADFLEHASCRPTPPAPAAPATPWIAALAAELERQGTAVRCGYEVGDDTLDLVVGDGADARAVDCRVHPDGGAAHIARRRALRRAGWRVTEAWASRHEHDPVRAMLEL